MDRRRFLGWSAVGGIAVVGAAVGLEEATGGGKTSTRPSAADRSKRKLKARTRTGQSRGLTTLADGVVVPTSEAIVAENAKPGNAWWVTSKQTDRAIEGFASQVSAVAGDQITLYVNTSASNFHVEVYRMGYYQGIGARLIWQSAELPGVQQPDPVLTAPTNTIECQWSPSLNFRVGTSWPPGAYLLKLVGTTGEQQFVPLCIRDDSSTAAIVVQSSVTTWQAYNRWGGYSLYYGNDDGSLSFTHAPGGGTYDDRARIVSFDRPYDYDWANGASDFVGNEFPVVYHAEQLGLDVTYWTDIDLHVNPQLLSNHKAVFSLGHDEYWSTPMRNGADAALASGVNFRLPRGQRLLPPDPLPVVDDRTQPPAGLLQGRDRGPTHRSQRRAGHRQLATTTRQPTRGTAHRVDLPRRRGQRRRGDRRPHTLGPRWDGTRVPTSTCRNWCRVNSTATCRVGQARTTST